MMLWKAFLWSTVIWPFSEENCLYTSAENIKAWKLDTRLHGVKNFHNIWERDCVESSSKMDLLMVMTKVTRTQLQTKIFKDAGLTSKAMLSFWITHLGNKYDQMKLKKKKHTQKWILFEIIWLINKVTLHGQVQVSCKWVVIDAY